MKKIYMNLYNTIEIGDDIPIVIMGVLNLSPESFYQRSVYSDIKSLKKATLEMIEHGAKMLDLGARSTAPWSKKISIEEEINRLKPAMENVCKIISTEIIISVDTQYCEVAQIAYDISLKYKKNIIINDVSCLKTDPSLQDFIIENDLPIILMASKEVPGDLCTIEEIINEFEGTINNLKTSGYDVNKVILDPGIGKWIDKKMPKYDLKIIHDLSRLRQFNKPILVAISRKSFIGATLNIPEPEKRLNGTLAATTIAVYNGAHIVRTHDVSTQLIEFLKMTKAIRDSNKN
ncbi:MAG: dihydropteroate synthase [Promethearchaeota archaeon]